MPLHLCKYISCLQRNVIGTVASDTRIHKLQVRHFVALQLRAQLADLAEYFLSVRCASSRY